MRLTLARKLFIYFLIPIVIVILLIGWHFLSAMQGEINDFNKLREELVISVLIGIVATLVLTWMLAKQLVMPLRKLVSVATSMRQGDYTQIATNLPKNELGTLGKTLNALAKEFQDNLAHLDHRRNQLEAILASMKEGVIAISKKDKVLFSNNAADHILGVEIQASSESDILKHIRNPEITNIVESLHKQDTRQHKVISHINDNQEQRFIEIQATTIKLDHANGVLLVLHDITEMRKLERIRHDFVDNASHELRTPLTAIKGYVETLIDDLSMDENTRLRFLERTRDNVTYLTQLTHDLLSLAKIEAEEATAKNSEKNVVVDVCHETAKVIERHKMKANDKSIELTFEKKLASNETIEVASQPHVFAQIMDNLVENALKFTPENGRVQLIVKKNENAANHCLISVCDSGIGIPNHEVERIFERFYQVDKGRSRSTQGTGLGLSIVRHLVESIGGRISVSSQLGSGSQFRISLPIFKKS